MQNCKKTAFCARYVSSLKKQRLIVLFTSDVMYKKHKRLAYASLDLLSRYCKAKLVEQKILGLFENHLSVKSLSLPLKSHMNVH